MDVRDVGVALWRQRLLVALVLLVTAGATALGVWFAPKSYTATATLSATRTARSTSTADELAGLRASLGALAGSRDVVAAVAHDLAGRRSATRLRDEIDGQWLHGTVLIEVEATDSDPATAAQIANSAAAALRNQGFGRDELVVAVRDPATRPTSFSSPDLRLVIALAALLGLGLATAAAVVRDRRTNTVDDAATVEDAATAPLLAHLVAPPDLAEMPAMQPGTAEADTFRHVRVAIEDDADSAGRALVVVSGVTSGDVNVWVGANAALALATRGHRVLLVDGRMGERFGRPVESEPDTSGLYDVLLGAPLGEAMSPGPVDHLMVLPSGSWGDEPVEELLRRRFESAMASAMTEFDVVLVLGPPLEICDDARVMAATGSLLLAVVEGEVSVNALRVHADRVRAIGARLLGVVLVSRRREKVAA